METTRGAVHPTRFGDLAVTIDFHCQSACRFCIVREGMNHYRGVPLGRFMEVAEQNARDRRYERVIFTGGEVTLERGLFDFLDAARGRFDHIRLQTNARRLEDPAFARELRDAGVDELLASLHGPTAEVQDHISQRPGSFDEAMRGIQNAMDVGMRITSNTVMNADNVAHLAAMPEVFASVGVTTMELWHYLPMESTEEARRLIPPLDALLAGLLPCLAEAESRAMEATVKYVPRCRLGRFADRLDNRQADVVIVESFWDQFPKFSCLYEAICDDSERCLGLHHPYVRKYGWEEQCLKPTPRTRPWEEASGPDDGAAARGLDEAWHELVADVPADTPGLLERAWLTRNEARFRYTFDGGGSVELVLGARDESRAALRRTASFNVFYTGADITSDQPELRAAMKLRIEAFARSVMQRDRGQLTVEADKGLGRDHVRRKRRLKTV